MTQYVSQKGNIVQHCLVFCPAAALCSDLTCIISLSHFFYLLCHAPTCLPLSLSHLSILFTCSEVFWPPVAVIMVWYVFLIRALMTGNRAEIQNECRGFVSRHGFVVCTHAHTELSLYPHHSELHPAALWEGRACSYANSQKILYIPELVDI